jgi:hypothetical protein
VTIPAFCPETPLAESSPASGETVGETRHSGAMDPKLRIVTLLPLAELWDDDGSIEARKGELIGSEGVREFLRTEEGPLVKAFIGSRLICYTGNARFDFWKGELRDHLNNPEDARGGSTPANEYPNYVVYEWFRQDGGGRILVAEGAH